MVLRKTQLRATMPVAKDKNSEWLAVGVAENLAENAAITLGMNENVVERTHKTVAPNNRRVLFFRQSSALFLPRTRIGF